MGTITRRAAFAAAIATLGMGVKTAAAAGAPESADAGARRRPAEFVPLGDFTLNQLVSTSRRPGYVVLSLIVETAPEDVVIIRDVLPRLRDAAFRRLVLMSERGQLRPAATDPVLVKDSILEAVTKVQTTGIRDVLIVRLLHS